MKALFALAKLDLLLWRRMPLALASALIPPVGMTLLLVTLSLAVIQQPVALVVEGHGPATNYMRSIIASDDDAYFLTETDAHHATQMLTNQQVAAIITIPKNFDNDVRAHNGQVILTLNNVDIDFADDIRRSVDRSVAHFDAPVLSSIDFSGTEKQENHTEEKHELNEQFDPFMQNYYRITIDEHDLRKTNVQWFQYQVIPSLVLLILNVGFMGTALLCGQDKERKTARYLAIAPQPAWLLIAGRLLGGVLASLITLLPATLFCIWLGIVTPAPDHWPALIAIFIGTAICASGLGAIVGTIVKGSRNIALIASITASYLFFLGGGFTTIAFVPQWLRDVSGYIPTRYAIDGLRQVLFYTSLDGVTKDITILFGTGLVAIIVGGYFVRKSWSD